MRALLGLLFFSMLLTIGASLECDECRGPGKNCTKKVTCSQGSDTCMSTLTETRGQFMIVKGCTTRDDCKRQQEMTKSQSQASADTLITVECSKAPPSAGSLLLALLSGLLLLKILV